MPCLTAIVAAIVPRAALVVIWILSDLVSNAFSGYFWPLLGLIFLPMTTLAYVVVFVPTSGNIWGWLLVLLGFLYDLASIGGSTYANRGRLPFREPS